MLATQEILFNHFPYSVHHLSYADSQNQVNRGTSTDVHKFLLERAYKLIHFNRSLDAYSTFVDTTLNSFLQLNQGDISHQGSHSVQAPRGSLNLSLILLHIL